MRTVYVDESGRAGDTQFVGMAACDADPETWIEFDRRWRGTLVESKAPFLHMREFAGRREAFKGWTEAERKKLMHNCLQALDGLEIIMLSTVIKDSDFRRLQPETQAAMGDPYSLCFQDCLYDSALAGYMGSLSVLAFNGGGLLIETSKAFLPAVEHVFEMTTADGALSARLRARAVYSHRRTASERDATYASGFAFLDLDDPATSTQVCALLAQVTPVRQHEQDITVVGRR